MKIMMRLTAEMLQRIRADLRRPHAFAHERVGFVIARPAPTADSGLSLMAYDYFPVEDGHYLDRPDVGAFINVDALRIALQRSYQTKCSTFHIHMHAHRGRPWFGKYDLSENAKFVPDFFNVAPRVPHGALILSEDAVAGLCWVAKGVAPATIDEIVEVGAPLRIFRRA